MPPIVTMSKKSHTRQPAILL